MSAELVLYTNPMSRGRTARWMLEEVGAPYRVEVIDYGPAMKSPDYLAINPMGKVPALRHGDTIVTECAAICAYLADAFPEAGLAPRLGERGPYYRWLFFGAGCFDPAMSALGAGALPPPDKAQMVGWGSVELTVQAMLAAVGAADPYLCGARFTASDLYLGSQLDWSTEFKLVEPTEAAIAYLARVTNRPAFRRANDLDDALMPQEGAALPV